MLLNRIWYFRTPSWSPWLAAATVGALYAATACPDFGGVSADTGNYLLGMAHYDPAAARPHLPSSWLFMALLRGLAAVFGPHGALVALAVGCSAASAGLLRLWAGETLDRPGAWTLTALVFTQPVVWFYGTVPEVYALDLLLGLLTVVAGRRRRGLLALPLLFAVAAALRPTTPALLLPLYLWLWWDGRRLWSLPVVAAAHAAAAVVLALLAWPTLAAAGGAGAYLDLYRGHLTVDWSPVRNLWGMSLYLATLGATGLVLLLAGGRRPLLGHRALSLVWILPPLVFFVLGHYQKGYILLVVAPLLKLLAGRLRAPRRSDVLTLLALVQAVVFLFAPWRAPDPDVLAAPSTRSLGPAEVWIQRVGSTHLMGLARPRALALADADVTAIASASGGRTLLVDPTVPLTLRALQVTHPRQAFAVLDPLRPDHWRRHAGLDEETGHGMAELLAGSVLVTRRDLAAAELDTTGWTVVHEGESLLGLRVPQADAERTAAYYEGRFVRR